MFGVKPSPSSTRPPARRSRATARGRRRFSQPWPGIARCSIWGRSATRLGGPGASAHALRPNGDRGSLPLQATTSATFHVPQAVPGDVLHAATAARARQGRLHRITGRGSTTCSTWRRKLRSPRHRRDRIGARRPPVVRRGGGELRDPARHQGAGRLRVRHPEGGRRRSPRGGIPALKQSVRNEIGADRDPRVRERVHAEGNWKTRSLQAMRRVLRKVACRESDQLGDVSTLADPSIVALLIEKVRTRSTRRPPCARPAASQRRGAQRRGARQVAVYVGPHAPRRTDDATFGVREAVAGAAVRRGATDSERANTGATAATTPRARRSRKSWRLVASRAPCRLQRRATTKPPRAPAEVAQSGSSAARKRPQQVMAALGAPAPARAQLATARRTARRRRGRLSRRVRAGAARRRGRRGRSRRGRRAAPTHPLSDPPASRRRGRGAAARGLERQTSTPSAGDAEGHRRPDCRRSAPGRRVERRGCARAHIGRRAARCARAARVAAFRRAGSARGLRPCASSTMRASRGRHLDSRRRANGASAGVGRALEHLEKELTLGRRRAAQASRDERRATAQPWLASSPEAWRRGPSSRDRGRGAAAERAAERRHRRIVRAHAGEVHFRSFGHASKRPCGARSAAVHAARRTQLLHVREQRLGDAR